ncbi:hypothetical protein RFI_28531 [Reticulomyxa filosa]|uniref:Uncharacterized protein n=1 Tax=Reticulomyxa filosa TaxID=46433 RepID=X6M5F8_RETFI|nr:hypothetical protein RFI_28531 [Reticulomyxa filosa]|eukprot:ETO08856.1 hypothetical protein RFI_28531 [Reticulomyxa filosa]
MKIVIPQSFLHADTEFLHTYDFLLKATVTLCREGMLCNTLQKDPFCLFFLKKEYIMLFLKLIDRKSCTKYIDISSANEFQQTNNTVNIDPSVVKSDNLCIKGKKKGWKKAYVTFIQKYEMDWSAYESAPALLFNTGQKNDAKKKRPKKKTGN